jgi:AAA family ATP:ADP antiporter
MSDASLVLDGHQREKGTLDRFLSVFSTVHAGEGAGALLLALNVFLLLAAYYVLKTVREPLILNQPGGAEVKSYASAGQAVLFLLLMPLYSLLSSKVNRVKLVGGVTAFFVANLLIFASLGGAGIGVGVPFFLWLGIFNMLAVAQFWGFANDLYTEEQGKRLFPIVGVGASLGAWGGSLFAGDVYRAMGPFQLMMLSAGVLVLCILLTIVSHRRDAGTASADRRKEAEKPLDRSGAFRLLLQNKYLLLIAGVVLLMSTVNSTGEYILSKFVTQSAAHLSGSEKGAYIGEFYGSYFSWVNLLGFLIQTFLVSRLFKWIGVRGALFILPVIAMGGYGALAFIPVMAIVRSAKILENATDYSLNNTVRHALYLPTSREAKYKAKAVTDTFFVRFGDLIQAGIVFVGAQLLAFSTQQFALVNLVLVVLWLVLAVMVYRRHRHLAKEA